MLFRSKCGKLIEINRYNFITDKEYYNTILNIK